MGPWSSSWTSSPTNTRSSLLSRSSTRSKSSKSTPSSDPTARRRLTSDWLPTTTPWTLLTRLESSKHQNSFLLASHVLLSYGLNNIKFENHTHLVVLLTAPPKSVWTMQWYKPTTVL